MKYLISLFLILGIGLLYTPQVFASSGHIAIPNELAASGSIYEGLLWTPNNYTQSPYMDPTHYTGCSENTNNYLTGVLYNYNDNSIAASGMNSNVSCDGFFVVQNGNIESNFQDNTPYYAVITDVNSGQSWTTPCFEDTGNDSQLVPCPGVATPPVFQLLSNTNIQQGATYTASGSFTDSDATSWTATVDYGDGSGAQPLTLSGTNFTLSHQYNTQGTYYVSVTVTDNQGQTAGVSALINVAGSGTISIPSQWVGSGSTNAGLLWNPGGYTASPSIDPYHYWPCDQAQTGFNGLIGALYNHSTNSLVTTTPKTYMGCDGYMVEQDTSLSSGTIGAVFQDNTPYYFIITDQNTGQTWTSPCFEDTGNDSQLVSCSSIPSYSLSGTVFTDSNHNGVQDNGEQGYNNATVTVSQNNQTVASTTTDTNGNYSFPSFNSGTYSVAVTVPSGDIATTTNPASVDLTADTTQNFGIAPATTTLTPSQTSYILHNSQNGNEGASTYMELTYEGKGRALVQFSQSQIAAAIGNDSNYTATLKLPIVSTNANWDSGRQIDVDLMEQSWIPGNGSVIENGNRGTGSGVTWNCSIDSNITNDSANCSGSSAWDMLDEGSWPFNGTPTATATITNNETGTVSFNVTSDVQSFISGTANDGWIVRKDDETREGDIEFASLNNSNKPQLVIIDH